VGALILATVYCGLCVAEGRPKRGRLGEVIRNAAGELTWYGFDARFRKAGEPVRRPMLSFANLVHAPNETLPARCKWHGHGRVSVDELTKVRGNVVVTFTAQT
jgi:hypothetical protein